MKTEEKIGIVILALGVVVMALLASIAMGKQVVAEVGLMLENYQPACVAPTSVQLTGKASWYDYELTTASGVTTWSLTHRTAASRDLPRKSMALVTNLENGKSVEVLINDYGPNATVHPDRIIDLSSYAFAQIAPLSSGVIPVKVEKL